MLLELNYTFNSHPAGKTLPVAWSHTGVVGSGDLEILMEQQDLGGAVKVKIVTPVKGFDYVWEKVLEKFTAEHDIRDISIEINDNNATPFIVFMRLKQALIEAMAKKGEN